MARDKPDARPHYNGRTDPSPPDRAPQGAPRMSPGAAGRKRRPNLPSAPPGAPSTPSAPRPSRVCGSAYPSSRSYGSGEGAGSSANPAGMLRDPPESAPSTGAATPRAGPPPRPSALAPPTSRGSRGPPRPPARGGP